MIESNSISMEPKKRFFIEILTRDIDYKAAILDLLDNSIDAAKKVSVANDLSSYEVQVTVDKNRFIIKDNCGGISIDVAANTAFTFGNDGDNEYSHNPAGRYGIGMKRSMFKLGNNISIESATKVEYFKVLLDVDEWKNQEGWSIPFKKKTANKNKPIGTTIIIENLQSDASKKFFQKSFIISLKEEISEVHNDALENGIRISVNGFIIEPVVKEKQIKLFETKVIDKDFTGTIHIYKGEFNKEIAGWYIKFNNRLLIKADKTSLTGWGLSSIRHNVATAKFEDKLSSFRGYIDLKDTATGMLPFNTTKTSVDSSSEQYEKILNLIIESMNIAIPKFEEDGLKSICFKRPIKQVERIMKLFGLKHAKDAGEKAYEEFIKNNNIRF